MHTERKLIFALSLMIVWVTGCRVLTGFSLENIKVDISSIPEEDFDFFIKQFMTNETYFKIRESLEK